MPNRERRLDEAERRMARELFDVGSGLRRARRNGGLTLDQVAAAVGVGHSTIVRNEKAQPPGPRPQLLARHAAAVGLRLRIKLFPGDDPVHDAGQVALIRRFREHLGEVGRWQFEVPIPHPYDQRAFDAILALADGSVAFEFYTRLADVQAQLRVAHLKKRDAAMDRILVVVQATHANRRALREGRLALQDSFPGSTRRLMAALRCGEMPANDGVILF